VGSKGRIVGTLNLEKNENYFIVWRIKVEQDSPPSGGSAKSGESMWNL